MKNKTSDALKGAIANAVATLRSLEALESQIEQAAELIANCLTNGSKLLVCGNGGSAADAADFCTELACRFENDRRPYPAMNLAQGGSLITAIGNDYGYEEIFARQVRAFAMPGDLLIGITTSGKSKNVRRAFEEAKSRGVTAIALLGRDGGSSRGIADIDILIAGDSTARIQEAHKFLLHVLCQIVEERIARE